MAALGDLFELDSFKIVQKEKRSDTFTFKILKLFVFDQTPLNL